MNDIFDKTETQHEDAFLSLRHLEKVYPNGEKAVYDFNLDISRNEFIVIVGPSGCGKSTTLKMIAGLEDISSGDILLENELLNYKPCKDRRMAIVFQSYALYPQMSVYDNIAFPLTVNKYPYPKVNAVLLAQAEVAKVIQSLGAVTTVGVLYDCFNDKALKKELAESVCTRLGVSFDTAKFLIKEFTTCASRSKTDVTDSADDIVRKISENAAVAAEAERATLKTRGVTLDENFCELDESGNVKLEPRKMTAHEIRAKVFETADILDLTSYLDKLPKELSGGQMQRVALGRAIVKNVPLFLMDEPLSNLDAKLRVTMRSEIVKLHNKINATTIYVTHDQTEAMTMATRIVVMSKGYIQQIGTPKQVYDDPANIFIARFIGSPAMNILDMDFDRECLCLEQGELRIPLNGEFLEHHDSFYSDMLGRLSAMQQNFDAAARDSLLKLMSATGEYSGAKREQKSKRFDIGRLLKLFKGKSDNAEPQVDPLTETLASKREALYGNLNNSSHKLAIGIRPERIHIEKCESGKKYNGKLIVKPTVCELLGSIYNIHFDFCGKDVTAQLDAKHTVTVNDSLAVSISANDIYVFDSVTGERIYDGNNR